MKSPIRTPQDRQAPSVATQGRPARNRLLAALLLAALLLAALLPAALAAAAPAKSYTVTNDPGGSVDLYAVAAALTAEPIRIVGRCESACTEYLGARNVCVSPGARFMFHAAHNVDGARNEQGVRVMLACYPPSLASGCTSAAASAPSPSTRAGAT
jgi:hypothetical protein